MAVSSTHRLAIENTPIHPNKLRALGTSTRPIRDKGDVLWYEFKLGAMLRALDDLQQSSLTDGPQQQTFIRLIIQV